MRPSGVRLSGASTKPIPCDSSSSASRRVEAGSEVEQSTIRSGFFADASPSGPITIASTCGDPVTQSTTMSLASASAAALAASFAPRLTRSSAASRRRWASTVSGQPLSTMFFAMPWPMRPDADKPDPLFHVRFLTRATSCGVMCRGGRDAVKPIHGWLAGVGGSGSEAGNGTGFAPTGAVRC